MISLFLFWICSLALSEEQKHPQVDMFQSQKEYRSRVRVLDLAASPGEEGDSIAVKNLRTEAPAESPSKEANSKTPPKTGVMVGIGGGNAQMRGIDLLPADGDTSDPKSIGRIISVSDESGKVVPQSEWTKFVESGQGGRIVYQQNGQTITKTLGKPNTGGDAC